MVAFWKRLTRASNLPLLRLLLEVQVLALQNPEAYGHCLQNASSAWLDLIEAALPPGENRRVTATLCASVMDGLLLEFLTTGDRRRTTRALEQFIAIMRWPAQGLLPVSNPRG
jgi:hypothetical protein